MLENCLRKTIVVEHWKVWTLLFKISPYIFVTDLMTDQKNKQTKKATTKKQKQNNNKKKKKRKKRKQTARQKVNGGDDFFLFSEF